MNRILSTEGIALPSRTGNVLDIWHLSDRTPMGIQQFFKLMDLPYPTSFYHPVMFWDVGSCMVWPIDFEDPDMVPIRYTHMRAKHWFEHCLTLNYAEAPPKGFTNGWRPHYSKGFFIRHLEDFFTHCDVRNGWLRADEQEPFRFKQAS